MSDLSDCIGNRRVISTADARKCLRELVDESIAGEVSNWTRYSKHKVSLVPLDYLKIINYLESQGLYNEYLQRGRELLISN